MSGQRFEVIESERFGPIEAEAARVFTFRNGLFGFPESRRFLLHLTPSAGFSLWLQSAEDPALAFVVTFPSVLVSGYTVPLCEERRAGLGLGVDDEPMVLCVVNLVGADLTANLAAPIVVNYENKQAEQFAIAGRPTRHVFATVPGGA